MSKKISLEITSMTLHILAMLFMLCDPLWATIVPGNNWLTCIGRLAYPMFAFMIIEGYFHTSNLKKYIGRLALFALLSEIPFNLVMGSRFFYPIHQNVLFTFLIGICLIYLNERACNTGKQWLRIVTCIGTIILGFVLGLITFVDYHYAGVFTILAFYYFRGRKWWQLLGQALCLYYINFEILSGLAYEIHLFGQTYYFLQQGFALLALIPIWLYNGKQGPYNKTIKWIYYGFYPVHLLILALIRMVIV